MTQSQTADIHPTDFTQPHFYQNRELSELSFFYRVLVEALDARNPLLERVKHLVYFTKNTDEFFMKRIGGLRHEIDAGVTTPTVDGRTPEQQWHEAQAAFREMQATQYDCWQQDIRPALADAGLQIAAYTSLDQETQTRLRQQVQTDILPILTPLAYDPAHPFPFISNLSLSLGIMVGNPDDQAPTFTRVKVPETLPPFLRIHDDAQIWVGVPVAEVIGANLHLLIPNCEIQAVSLFRLTRSAEVREDEEAAEDRVSMIEDVVERRRMAPAIRLEVQDDMPRAMLDLLTHHLQLPDEAVYRHGMPLNMNDLSELMRRKRPDLKYPDWSPHAHPRLMPDATGAQGNIFDEIKRGDILLHHPYHAFDSTTQRLFDEAATDPAVRAVKVAIYRTDNDSQVLRALLDAATAGKQVAVTIELKARFDEQQNVAWVRQLEERGVHVAYGALDVKTHTKLALVVRQEQEGLRLYSHVGTGNYHAGTARAYVDLGLLTADNQIGQDVATVFNLLTGPGHAGEFSRLLIAPDTLRQALTKHIRREADLAREGQSARIIIKVNAVEDPAIVAELYRAAQAGVAIDLIVRDICRLRPGLEGISETVRVHSLVGRFLEHSRIFYFENGGDPAWYIGSADWMKRNLDKRMEAVTPIDALDLRQELRAILETMLADNRRRWVMRADGDYTQVEPRGDEPVLDAQEILIDRARRFQFGVHGAAEELVLERLERPRMLVEPLG
ncbi:MAG: polyphosphate kinase 1 [Halochromatium sp.]|uniref:polyphosphate kinase 1 n=1 Tax=Halochromatium sp. TaxID=2049430 RepID=UPI00397CD61E